MWDKLSRVVRVECVKRVLVFYIRVCCITVREGRVIVRCVLSSADGLSCIGVLRGGTARVLYVPQETSTPWIDARFWCQ